MAVSCFVAALVEISRSFSILESDYSLKTVRLEAPASKTAEAVARGMEAPAPAPFKNAPIAEEDRISDKNPAPTVLK